MRVSKPSIRAWYAWLILESLFLVNGLAVFAVSRTSRPSYRMADKGMLPTIPVGKTVSADGKSLGRQGAKVGDILLFYMPLAMMNFGRPYSVRGDLMVRRCVGTPGDQVEILMGHLRVNGRWLTEPYTHFPFAGPQSRGDKLLYDMKIVDGKICSRKYDSDGYPENWYCGYALAPDQQRLSKAVSERVPPDMYIVLGDYRIGAYDSHIWGFLPAKFVVGRVII